MTLRRHLPRSAFGSSSIGTAVRPIGPVVIVALALLLALLAAPADAAAPPGTGPDSAVPVVSASPAAELAAGGPAYTALVPSRVMDTRSGQGGARFAAGETRRLTLAGRAGVPADAAGVVLNVTATGAPADGYLTVFPAGIGRPATSNLNVVRGGTVANAVFVGLGRGAIDLYSYGPGVQVIVDVVGWFGPPDAPGAFRPVTPARLLDTRKPDSGSALFAGEVRRLVVGGRGGVPADAAAVSLNVTVTGPAGGGFLTAWPAGTPQPWTSNLNFRPQQTVANVVVVGLGADAAVDLFVASRAHVVVDVTGWFRQGGGTGGGLVPVVPRRIMDSRDLLGSGRFESASERRLVVAGKADVPADASAVVLTVTATGASSDTFLTAWPAGSARPLASNLNPGPGATVPNTVVVGLGEDGAIDLYNHAGRVDVIVDVVAWIGGPGGVAAGSLSDEDWLGWANLYRRSLGLAPLAVDMAWSAGAEEHARYMVQVGRLEHDERPGHPFATEAGREAARHGNLFGGGGRVNPRSVIEAWLNSPDHGVLLLNPTLARSSYGEFTNPDAPTGLRSGAVLDVVRGIDPARPWPTAPHTLPAAGAVVGYRPWSLYLLLPPGYRAGSPQASVTVNGRAWPVAAVVTRQLGAGSYVVVRLGAEVPRGATIGVTVSTASHRAAWSFRVAADSA